MPYIKQFNRKKFDNRTKDLSRDIKNAGELNYVIVKLKNFL